MFSHFPIRLLALLLCTLPVAAMPQQDRGFESAEAAFSATFIRSGIGQRGYDENREYAAALYQMPDGSWYATPVVAGGRDRCSIPYHLVPPEAVRIAGAHTHGRPELPGDSTHAYGTNFSQTDRRNAMQAYVASHGVIDTQLLLTSRLAVLRMSVGPHYDPNGSRIALACETQALSVDYSERAAAP